MTETMKSVGKDRLKVIITVLYIFKKLTERWIMLKRDVEIQKETERLDF